MRNLFRFYGIFVFIGLLFLTVSCAGGGSGDGGISYDDDDSATSSQCACADASFDAEHFMCVVQWDTYYNKLYFYANKKNNPKSTLVIRAFE